MCKIHNLTMIVLMLSIANAWGEGFMDDFDRPNGDLGADWATQTDGTIEVKIVDNEVLIAGEQATDWARSGLSRAVEDETRISFDFKADDSFNVHIRIDYADTGAYIDVYAWPGGPFSYASSEDGGWPGWIQIPGSEMIAGEYNSLALEQFGSEFVIILNGVVVGTVTNENLLNIGMVFISCDSAAGTSGSLHIDNVQIGIADAENAEIARDPIPEDGAYHPDTWVNISWRAGDFAVSHDVYIGDNFSAVYEGAEGTFVGNQTDTFIVAGFPGFPYPDGLVPGTTYYWRIDEVNEFEPNSPWKGDVWSFTVPPKTAYNPIPADGAVIDPTDAPNLEFSWMPGFGARLHTVFFGDNFDIVNNATAGLPLLFPTYNPSQLEPEKTYYWRVDEFDAISTYKGPVWSFTTATVSVVDDFEGYNGVDGIISGTWNQGTVVPSIERTIVRSGSQSMLFPYDNNRYKPYSDVGRVFELPEEDKEKPVTSYEVVSMYLHGNPTNDPAPIYLRLEDYAGGIGVVYNPKSEALKTNGWTQIMFPLNVFVEMGVDVDNLDKVYVGVGIDPEGPIHNLNEEPLQHNPPSIGLLLSNPNCLYCSYNGVVYIDGIKLKEMGDQYAQLSKISYFNRSLLTGCVFDGFGNAVGGALVTLTPTSSGAGKMYATTCIGAGRYLMAPVTAGYNVNVSTMPKTFSITLKPGLNEFSFVP